MIKRGITILICLLAAIGIVVYLPEIMAEVTSMDFSAEKTEESIIPQKITSVNETPHEVHKVYYKGQLIGVMNSQNKLDQFLKTVYRENYREEFPNSDLSLGKDIYYSNEQSFFSYEDVDEQILNYIKENDLFTLKCTVVKFSDENGLYAEIYVLDESLYDQAMEEYLTYFITPEELALLNHGKETPALRNYGSRAVGISILQTVTMHEDYAAKEEIMKSKEEVLEYIKYGDTVDKTYYTVQKYDTVAGVGSKNAGLSATQVMNLNRDKITSVDQVLSEGDELCVTYFTPIIDVVVNKESLKKEAIYPTTEYVEKEDLRVGLTETIQNPVNGSKNTVYAERWVNGVLISGVLQSSVDTLQPINEIVAVGTLQIPGVGTGEYRWPVDNPFISCQWGCYVIPHLHEAIDIQNMYDKWGNLYAADRGVVDVNSYDGISGNYVIIDHGNGQRTYYGHMNVPSPLAEGTIVEKGDVIGQLGMTGRATGPHVHFYIEDKETGIKLNPCDGYLDCVAME